MFVSCEVDSFSATVDTFNPTRRQNQQHTDKFKQRRGLSIEKRSSDRRTDHGNAHQIAYAVLVGKC